MMSQVNKYRPVDSFVFVPFLRLEEEYPEETQIYEIESEIDDAHRVGRPVKDLIQKRQQIIDSWVSRVENELSTECNSERKKELERELNRARQYENEIITDD
ncbi:hypothetical protein SAMN05216326_12026 [Nitrosomonas marina]|uniref:Uncharacterized protein n=1 Tax=Nitrosomonas marina TaxID=917 RepID=A0A1I0DJR1_9PROT|nr:hypothetical protein [Nitrosomonas marina]SET31880.1 hypothetical protein SAMN05216326_12026 [Nitrosomonas marina]